jgi:hypothetical protein
MPGSDNEAIHEDKANIIVDFFTRTYLCAVLWKAAPEI